MKKQDTTQMLKSLVLQENISEEAIITYLKANIKNAKKEIEATLKHIKIVLMK